MTHKLAVFLLLPALSLASAADGSDPLIRKRVTEVQFTLVATDRNNRPLPSLSPGDILVLENGQPVSRFELRSAVDLPLRLAVVLDLSDSTLKSWTSVRAALVSSLQQLMRPDDTLLLLTFNSKIQVERTLNTPDQLGDALQDPAVGGLTALYDTLYRACDHPLFGADREPHRSALILFSDGEDDLSQHGAPDAITRAQRRSIAIYTVSTRNARRRTAGDVVLHEFAKATGGRDFVVNDGTHLQEALASINAELRSSFLLYYRVAEQSGAGTYRRVRVIPTQHGDFQVRSRDGYFAAP